MLRKPSLLLVTTLLRVRKVVVSLELVALMGTLRAVPARCTTIRRELSPDGCTACIGLLKVTFGHLFWVTKFAASGAGETQVVFEGRVSRPGTGQAPQSLLQLEQSSPVSQVPLPQVAQMPPSLAQAVQLFPPCDVVVVSVKVSASLRVALLASPEFALLSS